MSKYLHLLHNFIQENAITQFLICYWICTESLNLNTHNYMYWYDKEFLLYW